MQIQVFKCNEHYDLKNILIWSVQLLETKMCLIQKYLVGTYLYNIGEVILTQFPSMLWFKYREGEYAYNIIKIMRISTAKI